MAVTAPEWLTRHGGTLQAGVASETWLVFFEGGPQYLLSARPAAGKYACEVMQTVNGRRLGSGATYATADESVQGALEDLRKALGW